MYLAFFSVIALASASWIARLWTTFIKQSAHRATLVNLYCAHDVIMRDIRMAPRDPALWKKREADALIWHTSSKDIGFVKIQDSLMRIEGTYTNDHWNSATKSLLVKPIDNVHFTAMEGGSAIHFTLEAGSLSVANTVTLMQRKLPWNM